MAQPLEGPVQTVNRAKLSACIAALQVAPRGQVLGTVTDSTTPPTPVSGTRFPRISPKR